ncbi:MAG: FHA domain-containing protein [Actinomycetota bacterium]|nr:FHA domain-containing protein [Actinomycetota bacterium]
METDRSSLARSQPSDGAAPRLVALSPPALQGTSFELVGERVVVGRGEKSDVRVDNQMLSRTHAAFERSGAGTVVLDLQSTNGTFLNDTPVSDAPRPLNNGDLVRLGEVELRYEDPSSADATSQLVSPPAAAAPAAVAPPQKTEYHIDQQQAHQLNNVGRDQYNHAAYYQYVHQQRESFARDIAATKTKARRLIVFGFVLLVVGIGVYFTMFISAFKVVSNPTFDDESAIEEFWGPKVGGVPVGVIGFGVAFLGMMLIVVGIVLHIVAAARRRQFETKNPPPAPPWAAGPPPHWGS